MKKLLYFVFSLLLLNTSNIILGRYVCCIYTGDNTQCEAGFESKKECNKVCPNFCEKISDKDTGATAGGIRN